MPFVINVEHNVGATVFELTAESGVKEGVVQRVISETIDSTPTTVTNYVLLRNGGTNPVEVVSINVYADLTSALAAYELTFV